MKTLNVQIGSSRIGIFQLFTGPRKTWILVLFSESEESIPIVFRVPEDVYTLAWSSFYRKLKDPPQKNDQKYFLDISPIDFRTTWKRSKRYRNTKEVWLTMYADNNMSED